MTTEACGSIFVIEVPPKIRRPNVQNKYTPPDYAIDVDDGVFDFDFYGNFFLPKTDLEKESAKLPYPFYQRLKLKKL